MNSKKNTVCPISPTSLAMITLSVIFFVGTFLGQPEQVQAQENHQFITGVAETTGWVQSLEDAVAQSETTGKPIMLVFSGSDWCSYCQLLEHEVFRTPEFESWSSNRVIKVMVDFPQYQIQSADVVQQNQQLKQRFSEYLKGYPTVLMIDAAGSVVGRTGYVAGGPLPWISKAESVLNQPAHHLAVTNNPNH